ncbi:MAG TPA: CsbD family protein [Acidobacteriaceae bacterium]|nr:CsbD family protein [Acidobacteriaceae bacterium]
MNKLEIEGATDKATGKLKEVAGKVTHSPSTVAQGQAEQVKGEVKKQAGKVQDQLKDEYRSSERI